MVLPGPRQLSGGTLLALDLGNSRLKAGLFTRGGKPVAHAAAAHRRCPEGLAAAVRAMPRPGPGATLVCASVVPALEAALDDACRQVFAAAPRRLTGADVPLRTGVEEPGRVGIDRLVNCLAAAAGRLPAVVIDCGSALTFDVISRAGVFEGGVIAPSPAACRDWLAEKTDQLPPVPLTAPGGVIGRNTVDALRSGLVFGFAGLVNGILDRLADQWQPRFHLVVTGGGGPFLLPYLPAGAVLDPFLTLRGIRLCALSSRAPGPPGARR